MEEDSNKNLFYAKFGDMEYAFSILLHNMAETPVKRPSDCIILQKNALISLEIVDSIFNPFHSGTLIISNSFNYIEGGELSYTFLGNGRDVVDIEIVSVSTGDFNKDLNDELNRRFMGMRFRFIGIECEDILYNNTICKKIELVEYEQYLLSENICNIFKIKKPNKGVSSYLDTNSGNAVKTGDTIKEILQAVLDTNDYLYTDPNDFIYKDPDTNEEIFEGDSDSVLNISPYGLMSYAEILNYVLSFHSFNKSPCILSFDRYYKKFELLSLSRIFKENNDPRRLIETLVFPSNSKEEIPPQPSIRWNYSGLIFDESKIDGFYVDAPTCKYNVMHSSNAGILSNSRGFKSMIFDLTTLNGDSFTKDFIKLFLDPFKNVFTGKKVVPNYYLSPNKKNNYSSNKGNLPPLLDEKKFLNSKLQSLLYLNNIYKFKLRGKISRQTLMFVDVIKSAENPSAVTQPTTWELNNLGRHLIVNVKHIFTQDSYVNEIETIKPYRLLDENKINGKSENEYLNINYFGS